MFSIITRANGTSTNGMESQEEMVIQVVVMVLLVWAGVDLLELVVEVPGEKSLSL
jgi:hypothetical protein